MSGLTEPSDLEFQPEENLGQHINLNRYLWAINLSEKIEIIRQLSIIRLFVGNILIVLCPHKIIADFNAEMGHKRLNGKKRLFSMGKVDSRNIEGTPDHYSGNLYFIITNGNSCTETL